MNYSHYRYFLCGYFRVSWFQIFNELQIKMNKRYLVRHFFLPPLLLSPTPSFLSLGLPMHCPSSHNRRTDRTKENNIQVHSATSYRIFQYLQYWYNQYFPESSSIYWYNQYFPESSSICNIGITSISQNLPVSAILIFGNDQYLLALQILENSGRYWDTSIYQYLYQYCRYWKILVKYWYYQYRGRLLHFD